MFITQIVFISCALLPLIGCKWMHLWGILESHLWEVIFLLKDGCNKKIQSMHFVGGSKSQFSRMESRNKYIIIKTQFGENKEYFLLAILLYIKHIELQDNWFELGEKILKKFKITWSRDHEFHLQLMAPHFSCVLKKWTTCSKIHFEYSWL